MRIDYKWNDVAPNHRFNCSFCAYTPWLRPHLFAQLKFGCSLFVSGVIDFKYVNEEWRQGCVHCSPMKFSWWNDAFDFGPVTASNNQLQLADNSSERTLASCAALNRLIRIYVFFRSIRLLYTKMDDGRSHHIVRLWTQTIHYKCNYKLSSPSSSVRPTKSFNSKSISTSSSLLELEPLTESIAISKQFTFNYNITIQANSTQRHTFNDSIRSDFGISQTYSVSINTWIQLRCIPSANIRSNPSSCWNAAFTQIALNCEIGSQNYSGALIDPFASLIAPTIFHAQCIPDSPDCNASFEMTFIKCGIRPNRFSEKQFIFRFCFDKT